MKILHYSFLPNGLIRVDYPGNQILWIQRNEHSGRVVRRTKINTLSKVQHTGIYLGVDYYTREPLILHNHYRVGFPYISTYQDYALGQQVYWHEGRCTNNPSMVLSIALRDAKAGISYDVLLNNCQTYTNRACHNRNHSEDVTKWVGGLLGISLVIGFVRAIAS
ncbi:hypothetical protein [Lewinella sp. LCG006]|uniref:hypothetical protein n=1 Tax=Lewinella sp. LCG006 TaxID=3231911 RepID=UPI003461432B